MSKKNSTQSKQKAPSLEKRDINRKKNNIPESQKKDT